MKVRVLSAEGRLSAWILTVLPFALAAVITAINPELSRVLTTDPVGVQLVTASLGMMLLGIVWMRAIVSIRV
jgi:tight adherence protein B